MEIRFDGKVAIVTGAGGGLGAAYARELARRGAKVLVNDLGDGSGGPSPAAAKVVEEIKAAGGEAMADGGSVAAADQMQAMAAQVRQAWGGAHILINNAGVLRDKSFTKMSMADWRTVMDVHLTGSMNATKAVWGTMRDQGYGRILMTTSLSGLWGNFGQANYGAAKMALAGLAKTLSIEGAKAGVRVNALAPVAGTGMTQHTMRPELFAAFAPENVVPAALYLVCEDAPTNMIVGAGAGVFHAAYVTMTRGVFLPQDERTVEGVANNWSRIIARTDERTPAEGGEQVRAIAEMIG